MLRLFYTDDDIKKMYYHIVKHRIHQIEEYDKQVEAEHKKHEDEMKSKMSSSRSSPRLRH